MLRDPIFEDPVCNLYDTHAHRERSKATVLPSDVYLSETAEECIALVQANQAMDALSDAAALAANGRWRFPSSGDLIVLEAGILEDLGFHQQATYRYQELLQELPDNEDITVALGTCEVAAGQPEVGVRRLLEAIARSSDEGLHNRVSDYLATLISKAA